MTAAVLQDALKRLVLEPDGARLPDAPPPVGAQAREVSTGRPASAAAPAAGGGGGFAESDYALRQYWPARTLTSSDGIFSVSVQPIRSLALVGGGQATFAEPS